MYNISSRMPPPKRSTRRADRNHKVDKAHASQPRARTHAFTGCLTCRERHVKCDLGQPKCANCSRLKITCEGYVRRYSWLPPKTGEKDRRKSPGSEAESVEEMEEGQSSRRVLFSDDERIAMTDQMRDECSLKSKLKSLDLDRVLKELQDKSPEGNEFSRIGPFGILPLCKKSLKEYPKQPLQLDVELTESLVQEAEQEAEAEQAERAPTPAMSISLSQFDWSELQDLSTWDPLEPESISALVDLRFNHEKDDSLADAAQNWDFQMPNPSTALPAQTNKTAETFLSNGNILDQSALEVAADTGSNITLSMQLGPSHETVGAWNSTPSILTMSNDANLSKIPSEARLLLDYYSTKVIDVMSMSPRHKPPWKTIHLPCAMGAFAEMIVHGEAKSLAKMALFYALLSVSSFHIGLADRESEDRAQYWRGRGALHKNKSESYLRLALDQTLSKSSRGKYKELLMAVLSMVTIGVFSGNMENAHTYLAKSESLIRNYGLPKPVKSEKVSKLHHIFSFLRIIHESTALRGRKLSTDLNQPVDVPPPIEDNSNEIAQSSSSRLAWVSEEEVLDDEESEEDSLFVSIYQLPTTLLSLLSQTSSLCKQLQSSESATPEFFKKCKIVEDRIFRWKPPESLSFAGHFGGAPTENDPRDAATKEISAHLVIAAYQALIVHFQRQIRNTNPRVLQHYVLCAADHLLAHEQLKQTLQVSTAPFPWPGFIVGCEAYDMAARQKIDMYLKMVRCYNVGSLGEAEKVIYEVWRRQDCGFTDNQWADVLKDWGKQIVLT